MTDQTITIRPEEHKDYKSIVSLILRSFQEGTDYSDGTDIIALVEEIRDSEYYIPELSFVAELNNEVVGHFMFSHFPLSPTKEGGSGNSPTSGWPMKEPRCMMCQETYEGSLDGIRGYIVYDMYFNA